MLKCDQCEFKYPPNKRDALKQHIERDHEKIRFKCPHCDYEAYKRDYLKKHMEGVHSQIRYKCKQCDFEASHETSLRRHIRRDHEGYRWNCTRCKFTTKFRESFKVHNDRHESGKELFPKAGGKENVHQCGKCGELFPTRIAFRKHKSQCQKKTVVDKEKLVKKSKCLQSNCCVTAAYKTKTETENISYDAPDDSNQYYETGNDSEEIKFEPIETTNALESSEDQQISLMIGSTERGFECKVCGKTRRQWHQVKSHIESLHVKGIAMLVNT
jgi:hypothetical protein